MKKIGGQNTSIKPGRLRSTLTKWSTDTDREYPATVDIPVANVDTPPVAKVDTPAVKVDSPAAKVDTLATKVDSQGKMTTIAMDTDKAVTIAKYTDKEDTSTKENTN